MEVAQTLTLEEILPALPPAGLGSVCKLVDLVDEDARRVLENPELTLLPVDQRPPHPLWSRAHCDDRDWIDVVRACIGRGVMKVIPQEMIARHMGRPALNGMFGVTKKGNVGPGGKRVLRLILNVQPINAVQRGIDKLLQSASGRVWDFLDGGLVVSIHCEVGLLAGWTCVSWGPSHLAVQTHLLAAPCTFQRSRVEA